MKQETYKIIEDEKLLREFIDWLPDLNDYEKFYVALFARKKYDDDLKSTSSDKMQLKRFTSNKEYLFNKLKQLEAPINSYTLKNTPATQKSLAVYITPTPRDCITANRDVLVRFAHAVANGNHFYNPHAETISCIQRAKSKNNTHWLDFDIDTKNIDLNGLKDIFPIMNEDGFKSNEFVKILESRGGYHILVNTKRASEYAKQISPNGYNWYMSIKEFAGEDLDQTGGSNQLMPIPGCVQGGFIPKFIKI